MNQKRTIVLIVDDEPKNVKLLEAMIAPLGMKTYGASSGKEALEMVNKISFDTILLDINMPGMNGIEVCKKLKEDKETRNIPVIFVTAHSDVKNHAHAMEAGGIGFITKPMEDILIEASLSNAARIKHLSDEVEDLIRQRQSLSSMIVHDISNLLTTMIVSAEIVLRDKGISPDVKENVTEIKRSGMEIHVLAKSLLDIEKMESGTMEVSIETLDAWKLADQRAQVFSLQAKERRITIQLNTPPHEVQVQADHALLSRIFDNLLANAVNYCAHGGSIGIDAFEEEGMVGFTVTNDGEPIPSEYHNRIFAKFSQGTMNGRKGRIGVGLGLTFCKMAVEAMGGTIAVESPVRGRNDGVRLVFTLPCAKS